MLLAGMPPFMAPSDEGIKLKIKWARVRSKSKQEPSQKTSISVFQRGGTDAVLGFRVRVTEPPLSISLSNLELLA